MFVFKRARHLKSVLLLVYSAYVRQNLADEDKSNFRLVEYRDSDRHCGRTFFQQLPKWCTHCEAVLESSAVVSWTAPAFSMMLCHIANSNAITSARQHFDSVILPPKKVFLKTKNVLPWSKRIPQQNFVWIWTFKIWPRN